MRHARSTSSSASSLLDAHKRGPKGRATDEVPRRFARHRVVARLVRVWSNRWVRLGVFLPLLLWPWNLLGLVYAADVGALGATLVTSTQSRVEVRFGDTRTSAGPTQAATSTDPWQLLLYAEDTESGNFVNTSLDLRRSGYVALATFVALTCAARLRMRHKLFLLSIGIPALHVLPILPLISFLSGKLPVTVFHLSAGPQFAIETAYRVLVAPPAMAFAVPSLLWILLAWWRDPRGLRAAFP